LYDNPRSTTLRRKKSTAGQCAKMARGGMRALGRNSSAIT
jgi:hypothetical protein